MARLAGALWTRSNFASYIVNELGMFTVNIRWYGYVVI
jgi:hypothetical protein